MDDIQAGVYSVLIRNLSQEDGGSYMCRVQNQEELLLNIELDVKNGENLYFKTIIPQCF